MKLKNLPERKGIAIQPFRSLGYAVKRMRSHKLGYLLVRKSGQTIGIINWRSALKGHPNWIVEEVMEDPYPVLSPETEIEDALQLLLAQNKDCVFIGENKSQIFNYAQLQELINSYLEMEERVLFPRWDLSQEITLNTRWLLDQLPSGLIILNDEGIVVGINRKMAEFLGETREKIIGKPVKEWFKDTESGNLFLQVLREGNPVYRKEARLKIGRKRVLLGISISPVRNRWGKLIGVVGTASEISSLKRARIEERIKERLMVMGEVALEVAHEIRGPLYGIQLLVQNLEQFLSLDIPEVRVQLQTLKDTAGRLTQMASKLLDFGRKRELECRWIDLNQLWKDVVMEMNQALKARDLRVKFKFQELPLVYVDSEQMRMVLLNLLENAIDFSPAGKEILILSGMRPGKQSLRVWTQIRDQGSGIALAEHKKIFNLFYTTKPQGKGSGIGLAICKKVVQEHGGTIRARKIKGWGGVFEIVLPISLEGENAQDFNR